jgi:hypothetical protein
VLKVTKHWLSFHVDLKLNVHSSCGKNVADGIDKDSSDESGIWDEAVHSTGGLSHLIQQVTIQVVTKAKCVNWALGVEICQSLNLTSWWGSVWLSICEQHDCGIS